MQQQQPARQGESYTREQAHDMGAFEDDAMSEAEWLEAQQEQPQGE